MNPNQWESDVLMLLQAVALHFSDTDAPLGTEARRLLAEARS